MSTGEYISRDVALRQLNATCLATNCNNYNGVMCRACAYADAMDFIDAIPAADVQPVKRGKWFHSKENYGFIVCSQCKHEAYWDTDYGQQLFDYCPYCGARMDGDTE
jgi:hypothetical protein